MGELTERDNLLLRDAESSCLSDLVRVCDMFHKLYDGCRSSGERHCPFLRSEGHCEVTYFMGKLTAAIDKAQQM